MKLITDLIKLVYMSESKSREEEIGLLDKYDPDEFYNDLDESKNYLDVIKVLEKYNIKYRVIELGKNKAILLGSGVYGLIDDKFDYIQIENIQEWLNSLDDDALLEYLGIDLEQRMNDDFWEYPSPLYHATREKNKDSILLNGLESACKTRGMSNRSIGCAIFTTTDLDELILGSYGDAIFKINTKQMKKDGVTPFVGVEPDVLYGEAREALANRLGIENYYYDDYESGMSPNTVIVYGNIPAEYLSLH